MADRFCKILGSTFTPERCGLHWIETHEQDDNTGDWYTIWLLVQCSTDRMLVSIDGPTKRQLCYTVAVEGHSGMRKFVSLDGAKRNAIAVAMQILQDDSTASACRRQHRRQSRRGVSQ